jgi:spermidine synthase
MPPLPLLVFMVGTGSLGAEIAAVRLLAPYFGASTVVWANTIGVVLVALSVGYWLGGRAADRRPDMRSLCLVTLAGSVLLALVPFAADPLLHAGVRALDSINAGAFIGSLLAVLILVAVPVLVLGAVSPWAIRVAVPAVGEAGRVSGRLYAISTAGSLCGTLVSALLLIPLVGTRRTFLILALAIALTAVAGLRPVRRYALAPAAIAALLALPVGTLKAAQPWSGKRLVYETETPYQYARVVDWPDGSRALELNEGLAEHSFRRPRSVLTGNEWDGALVLPFLASSRPPARIAILGNAAGTTSRAYGDYFPRTRVDGVELDPVLSEIGRRFFDMRNPRLHIYNEDARPFLRRIDARYDAIAMDAYRQPYIPFYLTTVEFFETARAKLTPRGILEVNVGHPPGNTDLERVVTATMRRVFPNVVRYPITESNTLLVGSEAPLSTLRLRRAAKRFPRSLRSTARDAVDLTGPPLRGGAVYTDDRAPVEWLIDESIVRYASGGR